MNNVITIGYKYYNFNISILFDTIYNSCRLDFKSRIFLSINFHLLSLLYLQQCHPTIRVSYLTSFTERIFFMISHFFFLILLGNSYYTGRI